jgi:hypothetical protein
MSDQFWLTKAQLKRIEPVFPRTRGIPRPACVTGIVHVIRTAMAMAEGHACESACGGLPSNPQHKFFVIFYDPWCELRQSESRGASVWCQSAQCRADRRPNKHGGTLRRHVVTFLQAKTAHAA